MKSKVKKQNSNPAKEDLLTMRTNAVGYLAEKVEKGEATVREALLVMSYLAQTEFK